MTPSRCDDAGRSQTFGRSYQIDPDMISWIVEDMARAWSRPAVCPGQCGPINCGSSCAARMFSVESSPARAKLRVTRRVRNDSNAVDSVCCSNADEFLDLLRQWNVTFIRSRSFAAQASTRWKDVSEQRDLRSRPACRARRQLRRLGEQPFFGALKQVMVLAYLVQLVCCRTLRGRGVASCVYGQVLTCRRRNVGGGGGGGRCVLARPRPGLRRRTFRAACVDVLEFGQVLEVADRQDVRAAGHTSSRRPGAAACVARTMSRRQQAMSWPAILSGAGLGRAGRCRRGGRASCDLASGCWRASQDVAEPAVLAGLAQTVG